MKILLFVLLLISAPIMTAAQEGDSYSGNPQSETEGSSSNGESEGGRGGDGGAFYTESL